MTDSQLHDGNGEIKRTVIYTVQIEYANPGAWYKDQKGNVYDCLLEIVDKQLGGQEIMFRLTGCYYPVKFIKLQHCTIIGQRFAEHEELIKYYGK